MRKICLSIACALVALSLNGGQVLADSHTGCDVDAKGMEPSGTVKGHVDNIGFMVSARWGEGVLTLPSGEEKPFNIFGFKALETGLASVDFEGEVYNLENVDDFVGSYYGAAAGVALIHGEGESIVNNARCVIIKARSTKEGLQVSGPAPGGVEISWD